ncbi:MAG: gliding motility-associated C-terminal domain-containing protein [Bacteroidia bacterium]|nr:gliding motility-associated C-terminal domain-containing protein [Bacteroidia bacterium]
MKNLLKYGFIFLSVIASSGNIIANVISSETIDKSNVLPVSFVQSKDIFGTRVFIENNEQFNDQQFKNKNILYVLDNGLEKIYFSKSGLTYVFTKEEKVTEETMEDIEHGKVPPPQEKISVEMNWVGATTSDIELIPSEKQNHYFTYGEARFNSNTYKKLCYRNVYKGIDIEYLIPSDKEDGIKYNIIVHPGAKPEQVRILYSGNLKNIRRAKDGTLQIKTKLATITEHAPLSFDNENKQVASSYKLSGDTIGFLVDTAYNKTKTLIIDPWVNTSYYGAFNNSAYDVDYDYFGNTYVYGSAYNFKVSKFSPSGALVWTFAGVIVSVGWNSQNYNYAGNFCIEKFSGKCYVGEGVNINGSQIVRLNTSGNYDNFINTPNINYQEVWDLGFHCSNGTVFSFGGGHNTNTSAATITYTSNNLLLSTFQPTNTNSRQDIASHCMDDSGHVFVAYSTSANPVLSNKLARVNSTFNGNLWTQPSGFFSLTEALNKGSYISMGNCNSNGFNCLAVNAGHLFYYDGYHLAAYSVNSGSLLSSTTLSTHIVLQQGGIAVDDCNNLYLGSKGKVLVFNYNGNSFNAIGSISLSATGTNVNVYDIKLDKSSQSLYVCGHGVAGVYPAVYSSSCSAAINVCQVLPPPIFIVGDTITCTSLASATAIVTSTNGPFTYYWLPSGQTGSVISSLVPGTYTVVATNTLSNLVYTSSIHFNPFAAIIGTLAATSTLNCYSVNNGTASVINLGGVGGIFSYLWNGPTGTFTTPSISGLGVGAYTVTVTNPLSLCSFIKVFSITQPPPLTLSLSVSSTTTCPGVPVTLNARCAGGSPFNVQQPYFVYWQSGPLDTIWVNTQNIPGTYTFSFSVKDSKSCMVQSTIAYTVLPVPVLTVTPVHLCLGKTATVSVSGASGYVWSNGYTTNSFTCSPPATTTFTVTGYLNSCTNTAVAIVITHSNPIVSIQSVSAPSLCVGDSLKLMAHGADNYLWTLPSGLNLNANSLLLLPSGKNYSGYYKVSGFTSYYCSTDDSIYITVSNLPQGSINEESLTGCVPFCKLHHFEIPGGAEKVTTMVWEINGNQHPGNGFKNCYTQAGNYQLKLNVKDVNGCKNEFKYTVNVWPKPVADFSFYPSNPREGQDEVMFVNTTNDDNLPTQNWFFTKMNKESLATKLSGAQVSKLFPQAGTFPVALVIINEHGCVDTVVKQVRIFEDENVFIPNAFTPNNDGKNEVFLPVLRGVDAMHLFIFDRWGQKIFETNTLNSGWDGQYKGRVCEDDVYVWKLDLTLNNGQTKELVGMVTLLK